MLLIIVIHLKISNTKNEEIIKRANYINGKKRIVKIINYYKNNFLLNIHIYLFINKYNKKFIFAINIKYYFPFLIS